MRAPSTLLLLLCLLGHDAISAEPATPAYARPLKLAPLARTPARLARGRYLAEGVTQCFMCHSERDWTLPGAPPKAGRKGAGVVISDSDDLRLVAPNLTPDKKTGAGNWPDDALVRAIREGVGHDGRPLHKQMWYGAFRSLSDEDVASIVVYLRTLPPVENALPPTRMSEARRQQLIEGLSPLTAPVPAPDQRTPLARGRYLARIADCAGCHTSWHSERNPGIYAGGNLIERGEHKVFSANLTPDPTGMPYDEATFVQFIRNGKFGTLDPVMPWVVFRNMTDADLRDLRTALRRLWPVVHRVNNSETPTPCPVCLQTHGGGGSNTVTLPPAVATDRKEWPAFVGRYRALDDGQIVDIQQEGAALFWVTHKHKTAMIPLGPRRFFVPGGLTPVHFERDKQGRVVRMVEVDVEDYVYQRVDGSSRG